MADQRERKNAKRPKRPARKKPSNISAAQQAAVKERDKRDSLRAQSASEAARRTNPNAPRLEPRTNTPMASSGKGVDQESIRDRDNVAGRSMADAAKKIAGLATPEALADARQQSAKDRSVKADADARAAAQAGQEQYALAATNLYGGPEKNRAKRLSDAITATQVANSAKDKAKGNAVWMGPKSHAVRQKVVGDMPDAPGTDEIVMTHGEMISNKAELMSWLADPAKVEEIKKRALEAGLNVESFEDISKLWESVVSQAASTYSSTSKKVTPWALIALRGKYVGPDGKMQDKVTTSTQIDEMDPAQARGLLEQTASNLLGRAPSKAELDDFIAKAQMIARDNPSISTTTSKVGFDGKVETGTSSTVTKGGADVVNAQAQMAAKDQAMQSEDYGAFQAAGTYFPLLFDALSSPV